MCAARNIESTGARPAGDQRSLTRLFQGPRRSNRLRHPPATGHNATGSVCVLQEPACGGQRGERPAGCGQAGRARARGPAPRPSLNKFPFAAADAAVRVAPDPSSLFSQGWPRNRCSLGGIAPVLKPSRPSGRGLQRVSCRLLGGI